MSLTWKFRSAIPAIEWPAVPGPAAATALALQFQLDQTQWWPTAELERQQFRQLDLLLKYAYDTLRFWRRRLKAAGYTPVHPVTAESLRTLPLLTRAEVQAHGEELLSSAIPPTHGAAITGWTSGSTGQPIVYYDSELSQFYWRAFTLREHAWQARDLSGKLAAIRTGIDGFSAPGWGAATDPAFETGPAVGLNIGTDLEVQLAWLQAQNPDYLITYPSNLRALARRALVSGATLPRLRQARTYGETLPPDLRELCRRAWNVPLADMYSSMEVGYIALQCPQHEHYHVQAENLIVEILDQHNTPCAPGAVGRVVVTTLHNFAMPLIRYDIGDYAEVGEACDCGRGLPVLSRILGRVRNILTLPDGRQHWASFPSSKWSPAVPVIRQLQIVQKSRETILLRIVAPRQLTSEERGKLVAALQDCLGYPFGMVIEQVDELARAANMKFEEFVSDITQ